MNVPAGGPCPSGCPLMDLCESDDGSVQREILALIQTLEAQVPKWISVEERLPEGEVIALCNDPGAYCYGEYIVGYVSPYNELEGVGFRAENDYELLDGVTHWMPLPEPPEEATP